MWVQGTVRTERQNMLVMMIPKHSPESCPAFEAE